MNSVTVRFRGDGPLRCLTPMEDCDAAACCVGLALIASLAQSAAADPIHFSTSGQFELSTGTVALSGVSDAPADEGILLGTIPLTEGDEAQVSTPFQIRFDFDGGLPSIEVAGSIGRVNYNSNEFIGNPVVTTSATSAQIDLYPTIFPEHDRASGLDPDHVVHRLLANNEHFYGGSSLRSE